MIVAVLAATLTFTLPSTTAKHDASGRMVDCAGGPAIKSLAGWRLFAQAQSRTWRDREQGREA